MIAPSRHVFANDPRIEASDGGLEAEAPARPVCDSKEGVTIGIRGSGWTGQREDSGE